MPTTILINNLGVESDVSTFILTSVTRSDNGNPPDGISLPYALTKGSPSGSPLIWPWTGSFTDDSPPPFYNASGTINGLAVTGLTIPGVNAPPATGYTVVLGTSYMTVIPIVLPQDSAPVRIWNFVDDSGNPVILTSKQVQFDAWQSADGGQTKVPLFQHTTEDSSIVIVNGNGVKVFFTQADTANLINEWAQYNITVIDDEQVIQAAPFSVSPAYQ